MSSQSNSQFNPFFVQTLYNTEDFRSTWDLHAGLTGHLGYKERSIGLQQLHQKELQRLSQVATDPERKAIFEEIIQVAQWLFVHLGNARKLSTDYQSPFRYHLLSGYSRSGGTYLVSEYAKMRGIDILSKHIHWVHDFFPFFSLYHLLNPTVTLMDERRRTNLALFFSTLLVHFKTHAEQDFFRRTTLGTSVVSHLEGLRNNGVPVELIWRHGIRDIHGLYLSLEKMYDGYKEIKGHDYHTNTHTVYGPSTEAHTSFATCVAAWMVSNFSILPVHRGLPLVDLPIDMKQSPKAVIQQTEDLLDRFLSKHKHVIYPLGKPIVMKYGEDYPKQCQKDAEVFNVKNYQPDTFNFSTKKTIDDPAAEVFDKFLPLLTKAYQHFGIEFDGQLEQV